MKYRSLLALALCATIPSLACAKKPKNAETAEPQAQQQEQVKEDEPTITEDCLVNISLFNESVKNKQYADAYGPWLNVYNSCPNANKAIYTKGAQILEWKYENATTDEEKEQIRTLLMEMYDKRIKYFGDDPKYPSAYILGLKALDYCKYYPEDQLKEKAYGWLKESVEKQGAAGSQYAVAAKFMEVSYGLYKSDNAKYGEQFIQDYQTASGVLADMAAAGTKYSAAAQQQKDYVDNLFAVSGAADCSKLDEIYAKAVVDNADNFDMLNKIAKLYKRVRCTESEVYFAACEKAHKLQPSEESAAGCAYMSAKKENYRDAINYFEQAIKFADGDEDVADYQYMIALQYYNLKEYAQARNFARASLSSKADQGRCYILIGLCYASSRPYANDAKGAILNKTVYWAAVDKFVQARNVDESCATDANKLIASYSKYFPTKEERFDLPNEFSGSTFYVGGWIGETTTIR